MLGSCNAFRATHALVAYPCMQRLLDATVGWDALTPTEARVAELVAEGLTNPQVGKELLMGTETVETHLSRVFDKLGLANRKELIVAARRRAAERHR
jgi:DNA-binding CsgD family transcriptional regulator